MQLDSDKAVDLADLVIDDEVIGMTRRIIRGVEVTDETTAVDLISEVGHGGNYLATRHTMKHFRKEIWVPKITERRTWEAWEKDGGRDALSRAQQQAKEVLATHRPAPLPPDVVRELERIAAAAKLAEE